MTTMKSILSRLTQAVNGTDKELFSEQELNQFASFYLDKWDENTSEDVVAESFVDYWWNTDRACRRCSECGKLMREGYCADMGVAYYCSKDCLHSDFTDEEWAEECESNDQSYYFEINRLLDDELSISYRCCECGCEVYYTHDEGDYFPEECCVSASGEPFEDCCDDVYGTIGEAIKEWTSKTGIEQGERTDEQMMDFINEYEYEDDDTYFYIRTFTFE